MLYFIPAWYADNAWHEQEQIWYARRMHTEFDDTVKHIQLFHRNKICPFQITLLSFAPNFRHFLHRQGVYHAPYWSCFDAIQGIRRKKTIPLSYHSLKWPQGIEFTYSMFVVTALKDDQLFAKIEFGEDGNLIEVEMYEEGETSRKNIYDDRGFVSSSIVYREGKPYYQDYLGEDGIWRIRCFLSDGHVRINRKHAAFVLEHEGSKAQIPYQKDTYSNLAELIEEVFSAYVSCTAPQDIFCAALHPLHMPLLQRIFRGRNLVLSLFEARNHFDLTPQDVETLSVAGQLICDSKQGQQILMKQGGDRLPPSWVITPFDIRPDFGISQQMHTQNILMPVDGLEDSVLGCAIILLGQYTLENPLAQVHLFTRRADYGLDKILLGKARDYLAAAGIPWETDLEKAAADLDLQVSEAKQEGLSGRWFVQQCVDELSVTKCLRRQRLVADFRNVRDVYLRVVSMSMGIPQILLHPSDFVVSGKNGVLLNDLQELHQWLHFYLDELANWNQAMIAAYEMGKSFDTSAQLERWKGVLDSFENNSHTHTGNG